MTDTAVSGQVLLDIANDIASLLPAPQIVRSTERLRRQLAEPVAADASRLSPHVPLDPLREAMAARRNRDMPAARRLLEAAIEADPGGARAYVELASVLDSLDDRGGLDRLVDRVSDARDFLPAGSMVLARVLRTAGRVDEADRIVAGVEAASARTAEETLHLADWAFQEGEITRAAHFADAAGPRGGSELVTARKRVAAALRPFGLSLAEAANRYAGNRVETLFWPEDMLREVVLPGLRRGPVRNAGRIAIVVNSLAMGGSERNALTLANMLAERAVFAGVTIVVLESSASRHFLPSVHPSVRIVFAGEAAPDPESLTAGERAALQAIPSHGIRDGILRLAATLRTIAPDIVHCFAADAKNIQAGVAGILADARRIIMNPGGLTPIGRGFGATYRHNSRWMRAAYSDLLSTGRVRLVAPSIAAMSDYVEWIGAAPETCGVNYYGIDAATLAAKPDRIHELRRDSAIGDGDFVVGGAFRFEPVKQPLLWVDIARRFAELNPNARFVLLGDGSMKEEILARIDAAPGLRERFVLPGRVSDVGVWYRLFNVFLMTSQAEGFGNVLLEAQAAGVPVVATRVGGIPEAFVHGRSGFSVPATDSDVEPAVERLEWIAANPDWRRAASLFGRQFVAEHFPIDRMVDTCRRLYAEDGDSRDV